GGRGRAEAARGHPVLDRGVLRDGVSPRSGRDRRARPRGAGPRPGPGRLGGPGRGHRRHLARARARSARAAGRGAPGGGPSCRAQRHGPGRSAPPDPCRPPRVMSTPRPAAPRRAIGVDVGGTRTKFGLIADDGGLAIPYSLPTIREPEPLSAMIASEAASLRDRAGLDDQVPVGVAVPGILDEDREVVELAVNLDWKDLPLGAMLRERITAPIALGHDVRAGGMAEAAWGAGRLFEQSTPAAGSAPAPP